MKGYPTEDQLLQLLDDNGINYVISERMEGIMYLMFTLDDTFNPGARQDWEPRLCGEVTTYGPVGGELKVQRWAIFNVKTGREWKDADGDYLSFDYEAEAQAYLNGFFDAWKGAE